MAQATWDLREVGLNRLSVCQSERGKEGGGEERKGGGEETEIISRLQKVLRLLQQKTLTNALGN